MKKIFVFIFVLMTSYFLSLPVEAGTTFYDARLYITNERDTTFGWDAQPVGNGTPDRYEITDYCIETKQTWSYSVAGTVLAVTVPKLRIGHHIYSVRACCNANSPNCRFEGSADGSGCTAWSVSTGESAAIWVDGQLLKQGGWLIYQGLSPIILE